VTIPILGIDIGGTNTKFSLVTHEGEVLGVHKFHTNANEPFESFFQNLKLNLEPVLQSYQLKSSDLKVGVGCPNYSSVQNKLINPPNLKWENASFFEIFNKEFKQVIVENDANAAALGEFRWGKAINCQNFATLTVGTGIGSGIFLRGKLIRGPHGLAGEAGHLVLAPGGRKCSCGGLGHFESYCSVTGIKKSYFELTGQNLSYREIVPLYKQDDLDVLTVYESTAEYFAIGISHMVTLLGLEKIILTGGGMVVGKKFLEIIKSKLERYIFPNLRGTFSIELSELALTEGAVLGAAALIMESIDGN